MKLPKINLPFIDLKYRILGIVGLGALLFLGYYDHLYKPHAQRIDAIRNEMDAMDDRIAIIMNLEYPSATGRADVIREMQNRQESLRKTIETSERRLAGQSDTSKLLEQLTSLANAAGLSIRTLEPRPPERDGEYIIVPLVLEVHARFGEIVSFLENLKNLPVALNHMQIGVRERPELAARLVLNIYMK